METKQDNIRSVTLRVAIFFGLTTFTLCIAIFYIEAILDDTKDVITQKDSVIHSLETKLTDQHEKIRQNEHQINVLKLELEQMRGLDSELEEE